jgi:hypothetical protein
MSRSSLKFALALSLLLNAGVLGAVGYQISRHGGLPPVFGTASDAHAADYLELTPAQRERWRALEADFIARFEADAREITVHRERLIREIFSDTPALERIEAERGTIARLQTEQQQRVIAQLLREREILDAKQRHALADFLLQQTPDVTAVQRMHRK